MAVPRTLAMGNVTPLKRRIAASGYPQYVIAAMAQIAPVTLSEYANGHRQPHGEHLVRLCNVLGCEPEDLRDEAE